MKIFIKKSLIVFLFLMYFIPSVSSAADIFFDSNKNSYDKNENFLVHVYLDTEDKKVNAIEGVVSFSSDFIELKEIRDGNSSVNFWIERPRLGSNGKINFSGITTGGYSGSKMFLFDIVFQTKKSGNTSLNFENIQILENDGLGTKILTKDIPFNLYISNEVSNKKGEDLVMKDSNPPEDFNPFITKDVDIFNGKYFVVFSTVDKGVGINRYEVRESLWGWGGKYIQAESPYLLKDQKLTSKVYIKAVDNSGNVKIVKIDAQRKMATLEQYLIIGIILFICILFSFRKKIWSKHFLKQ
jgi:hypothetical protein